MDIHWLTKLECIQSKSIGAGNKNYQNIYKTKLKVNFHVFFKLKKKGLKKMKIPFCLPCIKKQSKCPLC